MTIHADDILFRSERVNNRLQLDVSPQHFNTCGEIGNYWLVIQKKIQLGGPFAEI